MGRGGVVHSPLLTNHLRSRCAERRVHSSCPGAVDEQAWMPIHTDWRLNEQMYGALQGLNKRATAERFGTKLTQQWRRSCELVGYG